MWRWVTRRLLQKPHTEAMTFGALMKSVRQDLEVHSGVLIRTILIVMIPTTIMSAAAGTTNESSVSVYIGLATIAMNGALVWQSTQIVNNKDIDVKTAYYSGSPVVRLLLLSWWLVLGLLPLGLALLTYGVATASGTDLLSRVALLALVVAVAVPSLIYQASVSLSMYALMDRPDMGPIDALRQSRKVTRGRIWLVIKRLAAMILVAFAIVAPPSILFGLIAAYAQIGWILYFLQVVVAVAALPVFHLYLARLYKELKV